MAMKPRAMGKKKMMRGGAVKKPAAKMMRGGGAVKKMAVGGITPLPSPSPTKRSNTEAFNSRTELNKKAQTARAAGPAVNAATAKKRADAAAALTRKRANAAAGLKNKRANAQAQTARAAGPAVNAATAKKRANAAAALMRKRKNAAAALRRKRANATKALANKRRNAAAGLRNKALKPIAKKPSKPAPTRSGPIATTKMGDEPRMYSKAIASAIKGSLGAASGSAKMMRGGLKKPVAKMRGGGLKKK